MNINDEYEEIIKWLYELHLFGIKFGLKKIEKLLEYLGNPHEKLRIIHVGGTNGKGSVCTTLGSVLETAGFRVGVNTSPHLSEFTERITINGEQISKADVVKYGKLLAEIREKVYQETEFGYATYFEVVTAMAIKYFADQSVAFVILEVGLGGTYDATNIVTPMVSLITDVSLDHTEHLGNTLISVAENKAGIIKPGVPIITSNTNGEVLKVITETSKSRNSQCFSLNKDFSFKLNKVTIDGIELDYKGIKSNLLNVVFPLLGIHQGNNVSLVLATLEILKERYGIDIPERALRTGLKNTRWPGRLEVIQKSPIVLLDGAHNPGGAAKLANAIGLFEYDKLYLVFGCSEEKDIKNVIKEFIKLADKIIITKSDNRRAAKPEMINKAVESLYTDDINKKPEIEISLPVSKAVKSALYLASNNDLVCICGSLFVVGEARETLLAKNNILLNKKYRIHY